MTLDLACVEMIVENEINQGLTQKQVAQIYAMGLVSSWPTDWARVNKAIIDRWSVSGLNRIKTWAWKIAESKGTWKP